MTEQEDKKEYICSLCNKNCTGFGHNPEPLKEFKERCCDECNSTKVIPSRISQIKEGEENGK